MGNEKKVSEEELVEKYQQHFDKNMAMKLLVKLRKATRNKPKVIAGTVGGIVTSLGKLLSSYGEKCLGNPAGFHVAVSDGVICVYCGNSVTPRNFKPHTKYGINCKNAPTGMHCLQ